VFVSHTSELRDFPSGKSYVAAVERAITAAGHVSVDMADFPAADQPPAQLCADLVQGCDVYLGVLGTRYGSPVRDMPEKSYTVLEFDTATQERLDRLVFLLDTDAEDIGIPASALIDHEFGARQAAFRRRVQDSELTTQSFSSPAELGQLVERSLRELADTRQRIASEIVREQIPAEPQPVRDSRFVNPPPATVPAWFQDRQAEVGLLAKYVRDPGIAMVTVAGRGGIGKTAMVCRLLKGLEAGRIPDVEGDSAAITVGGIVYLSSKGVHKVEYPTLVADLLRLLPSDTAHRLQRLYQNPQQLPAEMMLAMLEAFPAGDPVVVLLDNLESVMDAEREALAEPALHKALSAVLTAPEHAVTVIATTRVIPAALLRVEPARQHKLRLEEGLGSPDAEIVLRALDGDGHLGLRDAPDALLDGLRRHTRGFPRALEAAKAILDGDETLTPRDLLDRTRRLSEDQVVRVLVGDAYELLDAPGKQVMQALSLYSTPVSAVGVDFLLRPVNPTTDAAPILSRLVRRQLVRFHDQHYSLHQVDREYACSQLPPGGPGDSPATFTLSGLQARAADYYSQIRTPRESWRTLEDVRPQLAEFGLRCDTDDYDAAATVLQGIDFGYLQVWGHYSTLIGLHERIHGKITDPTLNATHLTNLGICHISLGDYQRAIDLFTRALAIARDIGNRHSEGDALGNLGNCHFSLGDYQQAIELHTEALAIARDIGNRHSESAALGNLGTCQYRLGDYLRAIELHTEALAIARDIGNPQSECNALGNLGNCHFRLGDYQQAIELHTEALAIARKIGNRYSESAALGNLGTCHSSLGDYQQAIELHTQALAIARDIGKRQSEGNALGNLGTCQYRLGDYQQAIDLHTEALAIARDIGNRLYECNALGNLGNCHFSLGDYQQAIDLFTQALAIARDIGNRQSECNALTNLGTCHYRLGDYQQAIDLFTQALAIARDIGNRSSEAITLSDLGRTWLASDDARQALTLLEQAVGIADTTGDVEPAVKARSGLARAQLRLGDPAAALATAVAARELPDPAEEPTIRLVEGMALLELRQTDESVRAFSDALAAADALLALAESNVAALQARALALSGLAIATADPARASEAMQAFIHAGTITSAAGVATDTRRLLDTIAAHDRTGALAEVRAAQDR
jgi:tetratricopeptide (TPR) repeat protein